MTKEQACSYVTNPSNVIVTIHDTVIDFTIQDHDELTLVFSATNSTQDWVTNALFFKKRFHSCRAHGGYVTQYRTIQKLIHSSVQNVERVHLTGYSMGGSIALLAAYDIAMTFPEKQIEVIAFDPLRVFNKNVMPSATTITYGNSTVHKLLRIFGFKHTGTIIHVGPKYVWWKYNHKDHKLENLEEQCVGKN
jgi:hypothetical protein